MQHKKLDYMIFTQDLKIKYLHYDFASNYCYSVRVSISTRVLEGAPPLGCAKGSQGGASMAAVCCWKAI